MIRFGAPQFSPLTTVCTYQPLGHPRLQERKVGLKVGRKAWVPFHGAAIQFILVTQWSQSTERED